MKRFLFRFLIVVVLYFSFISLIKHFAPFAWGNDIINGKIHHFEAKFKKWDNVYVGSSQIFRHVNVNLVDSLVGRNENSINLGADGMFYLETHFLIDKLIKNKIFDDKKTKRIFTTKLAPTKIAAKNLHSVNSKYFMDLKRFSMAISYYYKGGNWRQIKYHTVSFLENILGIGEVHKLIKSIFHNSQKYNVERIYKQNGFYSLSEQVLNRKRLLKKNKIFKRKKSKISDTLKFSDFYLKEINDMGDINFQKIGIKMYFLPKIKLKRKYYFDRAHYTINGANIYSQQIATYIIENMIENNLNQ